MGEKKDGGIGIKSFQEMINGNGWSGRFVDTGVKTLNELLGGAPDRGMCTRMLTGFYAGPNMGKTLTTVQLAIASVAAQGRPSLIIDFEAFFSQYGAYQKYVEPILQRYEVSPGDIYILQFRLGALDEFFKYLGKSIKRNVKGGKIDISVAELSSVPNPSIYSDWSEHNFGYIGLDGLHSSIKKFLGTINVGTFPARRAIQDEIILTIADLVADKDAVGIITFHAIQDVTVFGQPYRMWGGLAPAFADKNLILITKSGKQAKKDKEGRIVIDYRDLKVDRSAVAAEGLKRTVMLKMGWGIDDPE